MIFTVNGSAVGALYDVASIVCGPSRAKSREIGYSLVISADPASGVVGFYSVDSCDAGVAVCRQVNYYNECWDKIVFALPSRGNMVGWDVSLISDLKKSLDAAFKACKKKFGIYGDILVSFVFPDDADDPFITVRIQYGEKKDGAVVELEDLPDLRFRRCENRRAVDMVDALGRYVRLSPHAEISRCVGVMPRSLRRVLDLFPDDVPVMLWYDDQKTIIQSDLLMSKCDAVVYTALSSRADINAFGLDQVGDFNEYDSIVDSAHGDALLDIYLASKSAAGDC